MLKGSHPGVEAENMKILKRKGLSERQAAMVSMKRDRKEKKEAEVAPSKNYDDYPYGLSMSLEHDSLNKLGIKKLPKVGKKVKLRLHAKVTRVSDSQSEDGRQDRSVHLQVTHMQHMGDGDGDE